MVGTFNPGLLTSPAHMSPKTCSAANLFFVVTIGACLKLFVRFLLGIQSRFLDTEKLLLID